jgi:Leucine-rich repeat (LRR) protein
MTGLKRLLLSNNRILSLPAGIASLTKLEYLVLEGEGETAVSLPNGLENMQGLRHLIDNLHGVPEKILNLENLEELEIYGLNMSRTFKVPSNLTKLKKLAELSLCIDARVSFTENMGCSESLRELCTILSKTLY